MRNYGDHKELGRLAKQFTPSQAGERLHSETPFYEILYLLIFTPITVPPYFKPQSLLCCFGFPFNCGREGEKTVCGTTRDKWVIYLNTSNLQFNHQ